MLRKRGRKQLRNEGNVAKILKHLFSVFANIDTVILCFFLKAFKSETRGSFKYMMEDTKKAWSLSKLIQLYQQLNSKCRLPRNLKIFIYYLFPQYLAIPVT